MSFAFVLFRKLSEKSPKMVLDVSPPQCHFSVMSSGNVKADQLCICPIPFAGSVKNEHLTLSSSAAVPKAAIFSLLCYLRVHLFTEA